VEGRGKERRMEGQKGREGEKVGRWERKEVGKRGKGYLLQMKILAMTLPIVVGTCAVNTSVEL